MDANPATQLHLLDVVVTAQRAMLRARRPSQVVDALELAVTRLGGTVAPAHSAASDDLLHLDVGVGVRGPLVPVAAVDDPARSRLESVLPGLVEDAQRSVQRLWRLEAQGDPTLLDPLTGALQPAATRRLVERAAAGDVLVGVAVDHDGAVAATDGRARSDVLVRDLAAAVQGELDVDERLGRLEGPGVVALLPHPADDRADEVVRRVGERWSRLEHGGRHVPLGVAVRTLGDRRLADLQTVTDAIGLGGSGKAGAG
jgi:GGDEF domain-containing protein